MSTLITCTNLNLHYDDIRHFAECKFKKNYLLNNNLLDKPLEKSNKIAIVTFENRNDLEYVNQHNQNITEYCKKWNYEYIFYDKCIHNIYWCKLYIVLDVLKTGKYDYVMWMDSDTIIKNSLISLDSIINKYSSDIYVNLDGGLSVFCAGVFIIKNSPIGISYLEDCIKLNNKKCMTSDKKLNGLWAGLCYEQGVMNKLIFDKYYNYTTCLPKYIVYNEWISEDMLTCDKDTFILHIYGSPNELRSKCFKRFL
jgi:hypothetical protein